MNELRVVCYEKHWTHVFDNYHSARHARDAAAAVKSLTTPTIEEKE
jgi:hypothetical protein